MNGWIGVDLDGTLARYDGWISEEHIGEPIPVMVERIKMWLADGKDVRIFTARVFEARTDDNKVRDVERVRQCIQDWCEKHVGARLPVTNVKDYAMLELWDDRAVQIVPNTGIRVDESF